MHIVSVFSNKIPIPPSLNSVKKCFVGTSVMEKLQRAHLQILCTKSVFANWLRLCNFANVFKEVLFFHCWVFPVATIKYSTRIRRFIGIVNSKIVQYFNVLKFLKNAVYIFGQYDEKILLLLCEKLCISSSCNSMYTHCKIKLKNT